MSSLNKRYCKAGGITLLLILILILVPLLNFSAKKNLEERVYQNAEIAFVTVKKKAPAVKKQEKKTERKNKDSLFADKAAEPPENEETAVEEQEEITEEEARASEKASSTYKEYVLSRISAKKVYPVAARAKGQTGRVKINLTVLSDGTAGTMKIVKSSGWELLDEAALNAVKKALPFKKMPETIKMKELNLTFSMDFTLE